MTRPTIPDGFQTLTEFLVNLTPSDLTAHQNAKAKDHIADTLACGTGGMASPEGQRALSMMLESGETGNVPVWGSPARLTARAAAFCNGVNTHSFELDDTDGCDHSGAVVIPAAVSALGLARDPVSGPEFITAVVAGYEIAKRVLNAIGGYWPHNRAGWHSTATCGTFGAAVAVCRILRLSQRETGWALGHAASFSGGLWSVIHDASQTKRVHTGKAAEGGLTAALLARSGMTGPTHIFEDSWGSFLNTFAPAHSDAEKLTAGLGEVWEFEKAAIKPYPSCRSTHAAVDALIDIIKRRNSGPDDIRKINVTGPQGLHDMCGGRDVSSMASAQMSLPYALAALTRFGDLSLSAYSTDIRGSDAMHERMNLITLSADSSLPASTEPVVTVTLCSGEILTAHVDPPLGAPSNPLSASRLRKKLMDLMTMSLPVDRATVIFDLIAVLDTTTDLRNLPQLMLADRLPVLFQ